MTPITQAKKILRGTEGSVLGCCRNSAAHIGSDVLHVGYLNRNCEEELHVPVGPENAIDPASPGRGQPPLLLPTLQPSRVRAYGTFWEYDRHGERVAAFLLAGGVGRLLYRQPSGLRVGSDGHDGGDSRRGERHHRWSPA